MVTYETTKPLVLGIVPTYSESCEGVSDKSKLLQLAYREDFNLNLRTTVFNSPAEAADEIFLNIGVKVARAAFAVDKVRSHGLGLDEEKN